MTQNQSSNINLTKAKWRQILLAGRRQISSSLREKAARDAASLLVETPIFQQSRTIACYYPLNNEFDSLPIIEKIWQAKKNCYLPVVTSARCLDFVLYQQNSEMRNSRFYIPEPIGESKINPQELDLVLLPLLGFDRQGNRLGMGAGYYDRTFHAIKKPVLCGLAYEKQCVEELPHNDLDVRLNAVMTEKRIIYFNLSYG